MTNFSQMKLIPVVVKRATLHRHIKFWGGLLNPKANGGRGYYVRRMETKTNPLSLLNEVARQGS